MKAKRAVHLALAKNVRDHGEEPCKEAYDVFANHNADFFEGKLGSPFILYSNPSSPRALADYCGADVHGIESRVRIRPSVAKHGDLYVADVILHEMVHAWCHEVELDDEEGYKGHGPLFAGKCTEISATLGLGPVSPKGRGEGPDCARWPHNVRPEGYYGPAHEKEEREREEKKSKSRSKSSKTTAKVDTQDSVADAIFETMHTAVEAGHDIATLADILEGIAEAMRDAWETDT